MHALASPVLPNAGIRFQGQLRRFFSKAFEQPELRFSGRLRQPAVKEHRHRCENDAAVGVVLDLVDRCVTHAHRTMTLISLKLWRDPLCKRIIGDDAVDRFQRRTWSPATIPRM